MKKQYLLLCLTLLSIIKSFSQELSLDADIRQRFEYRHGYNTLFPDGADPAAFVRQRSRLNFGYTAEKLKVFVAVQDVSTWGDTRQILQSDGNDSFMLFQAWAEIGINENWSTKLGRQVIAYDDQRIFGGLDWAMQGRFHDAALLKYKKANFMIDLGFAYSQQGESNAGTLYQVPGFFTYKAMQYAYLKKSWEKSSISILALNTGFQKFDTTDPTLADGVYYTQTVGSYFTFPAGPISFTGSAYYQFGDAYPVNESLSAYQVALDATYKVGSTVLGVGAELLSGSDQGDTDRKSFFPLYGTNHKFNGFMDYFYVGNHANSVGLNDIHANAVFKTSAETALVIVGHYFGANGKLANNADSYLGTEIDIVYTQPIIKNVKLNLGYSHMFASESMSLIKGDVNSNNTNNWGWAQLIISPNLFKYSFK